MSTLTIQARMFILAGALLLVVVGSNLYLMRKLAENSNALVGSTRLLDDIERANSARLTFGEMRYWLTDLAVSQLVLSEQNARSARQRLDQYLTALAPLRPDLVAPLRSELESYSKDALGAVDEYTNDQRVRGNTLLASARVHSVKIDQLLGSLIANLNRDATRARDHVVADVALATRLSTAVILLSLLIGIGLTWMIVRSIATPVRRLVAAIDGLSAGDLSVPIPNDGPDEVAAMARALELFRDSLKERDRLVVEREQQQRTMAAAIATISEGFVLFDAQDRIALYNERFRDIYPGLSDLIRPGVTFADLVEAMAARSLVELDGGSATAWIDRQIANHRHPEGFSEYNYQGRWVRNSERRTQDGGTVAIYTDVTQMKEREIQLERAREAADEASLAKSQFLANMSHEIRTPMNAIIGMSHLTLDTQLSPKQRDYVGRIQNAATSLLGIINDILDFSKAEAGKLTIESIPFDLDGLVANVIPIIAQRVNERGLELLFDIPPAVPSRLVGDPTRLMQVFTNLLGNAVKFTESGEIRLAIRVAERVADRVKLEMSISDTGIGISEEVSSRLFQTFQQADTSTSRRYGGTGLGLAITKRLVELMGGTIWVDSTPGLGSTFSFTAWFGVADEARRLLPEGLTRLRVLVADDNKSARTILSEMLAGLSARVHTVALGEEAVAAVRAADPEDPFDVVLMDYRMPDISGLDAALRIRSDRKLASQPRIVMVTAFGSDDVVQEADQIGVDGFLLKPVNQSMLLDTMVNLFGGRKSEPATVQSYDLTGIRLLLAEDNPTNQLIVTELLTKVGAEIEAVGNGRLVLECLERSERDRFSAILMDIQMPEMDGFEATARIRADPKWQTIPIIALTAHAMAEERQRCLDAGMNGHVAKPIDRDALCQVIAACCGGRAVALQDVPTSADPSADDDSPPQGGWEEARAVKRLGGNRTLFLALKKQFLEHNSDAAGGIRAALGRGDRPGAEHLAHSVRGVAANLGATAVADAAAAIEQAIKSGPDPVPPAMIEALDSALAALVAAEAPAGAAVGDAPVSGMPIEPLLARLRALVLAADGESLEYFLDIKPHLSGRVPPAALASLELAVGSFDFAKASDSLDRIIGDWPE